MRSKSDPLLLDLFNEEEEEYFNDCDDKMLKAKKKKLKNDIISQVETALNSPLGHRQLFVISSKTLLLMTRNPSKVDGVVVQYDYLRALIDEWRMLVYLCILAKAKCESKLVF